MAKETTEQSLFDISEIQEKWEGEWAGMPEFVQEDLQPFQQIIVSFEKRADMDAFAKLVNQKLTYKTKSIWYPAADLANNTNKRYVVEGE